MSEWDNGFERELGRRLRRVDAPASLSGAVMSRIDREPRRLSIFPLRNIWTGRLAAMFLLTVLLAGAGAESVHHRRVAERARAEHDFARSLELTSRALEPVRRHLRQAGVALDD